MRNGERGAFASARSALRPLVIAGCALVACSYLRASAGSDWLEAGPFTSTNTAAPSPGISTTNTLVYGMDTQGSPVYGASNVILQSPADSNTYWVATTSGGIWKTINGGQSWASTTDRQSTLAIGAITIDLKDGKTMYAASGFYSAGGVNLVPATTLLKSIDGGDTWNPITPTGIQNLYLTSGGVKKTDSTPASIKNIVANGDIIVVAAGGSQGIGSFEQAGGLYRSINGGQTFTLVPGFDTEVTSLVSTTINSQTVMIAARNGYNYQPDNGIFYSINDGATWNLLLGPGTTVVATNPANNPNNLQFSGGFGGNTFNMKVAAGPDGSLFVAVSKKGSYEPTAVFYTPQFTPGATPTWYNLGEVSYTPASPACVGGCTLEGNKQSDLHFALTADPNQKGVAYVAGSGVFLPESGGEEVATLVRISVDPTTNVATLAPVSFPTLSSAPHPDTRSLLVNARGNLLTTDDGGVYALSNPGSASAAWSALGGVAAGGSPIRATEVYQAVMDPKTGRLGVAMQDNGSALSAPNTAPGHISNGVPWQNVIGGDGFSAAVNFKRTGDSIMYATADDAVLARVFANQNVSTLTPANLLTINVAGTSGTGYQTYENNGGSTGIVVAVNAVDPTKLLFRSGRLYTWADPGTALSGSIDVTDITAGATTSLATTGTNLFAATAWSEKLAYGTQDAPDAILAGGGTGLFLRTQAQANANTPLDVTHNLVSSYVGADPANVLFDPLTEHKFFVTDSNNLYVTNNSGASFRTLTLPANFTNPAGLTYVADNYTGQAINGVRALLLGGTTTDGSQGSIISTQAPFAANVQWTSLGSSLPNAVVYGLNYYSDIDTLVAALYGRGVYILYDTTSYYANATELWFGKAGNDSSPEDTRLTGNRALEKFGVGTLTLSGNPTYSGGTIIDAGVVVITADANLGAPQTAVTFNGGTLRFNAAVTSPRNLTLAANGTFDAEADATLSGMISGAGALNKVGPATLTLTGSNSYLGGTYILGGALAVGSDGPLGGPSGQIGIDAGTLRATASFSTARTITFGVDGGSVDINPNSTLTAKGLWDALGAVNKTGAGVLALDDVAIFQAVNVGEGTLQVDGVLNGTSLQVATGAALTGNGHVTAPTTVFGTLQPGAPGPGVLTFGAPLSLTSGSTLRLAIDGTGTGGGPGTYSQAIVNGGALSLGGTLSPFFRGIGGGAANAFTPQLGQQFLIASASGGVSGSFAGVDLTGSGLPQDIRMDTVYRSTYVDMITTPFLYRNAPAGTIWSSNQANAGAALDALRPAAGTLSSNMALQNAFDALYLLPPSQLGAALTGLSAQSEARGVANALDTMEAFSTALQDHLIGGPMPAGFNNLSLSVNGTAHNFYSAFNNIPSPTGGSPSTPAGERTRSIEPSHWWSSMFYQNNMTSTSAGITGGSANITGFVAGLEGEVKPGQLLGIAASFAHTDAAGTNSGSGDHLVVAAYGKRSAGPLKASAYGGVAVSSVSLRHDFLLGGGIVNQDGHATSLLAGGAIAYAFRFRGFDIAPTATAAFTHMLFDGTSVTSPMGFALNVPRQWTDRLRFTLGPTISRTVTTDRGMKLTASIGGGFLYQTAPVTALDAAIFTAPMVSQSAPAGGAGAFADVGLYASLTNWLTGFVRWHGEAREHTHSNQISGGFSATF